MWAALNDSCGQTSSTQTPEGRPGFGQLSEGLKKLFVQSTYQSRASPPQHPPRGALHPAFTGCLFVLHTYFGLSSYPLHQDLMVCHQTLTYHHDRHSDPFSQILHYPTPLRCPEEDYTHSKIKYITSVRLSLPGTGLCDEPWSAVRGGEL